MNLKEIRSELRKLSELAAGWPSLQRIAPLERDLALEKLRMLYDTLRFGAGPAVLPPAPEASRPVSASSAAGAAVSPVAEEPRRVIRVEAVEYEDPDIEMVDLSEVLSLDDEESAEPETTEAQPADAEPRSHRSAEPVSVSGRPAESARSAGPKETPAPLPEAEDEEYGPEIIEFVPDPDPFVVPVPKKEPVPEPAPAPTPEPIPAPAPAPVSKPKPAPQAAAPAPAPRPLIIPRPEPAPEPTPRTVPESEPVAAPAPRPVPVREPMAAPAAEREPAVVPPPAPAAPAEAKKPEAVPPVAATPPAEETPTLFDPDDAAMRHRHKQRVIMSLYDPAPAGVPKPAPERLPKDTVAAPNMPNPRFAEPAASAAPSAAPESEIELLDARTEEPITAASPASEPETHVLGEVINQEVHTLAETIAAPHAAVRLGAPIADLRQAIGINDKFLMIRDLFGGDGSLFDATVEALNAQESLDDCMIYIAEHFAWNPESDSAKLVMELLERKFA